MPRRTDIKKILLIGSGPIIIGQACEFDYSGSQACKALRAEGYEVTLVNSNPATIMTDPELAQRTYVEPLTAEYLEDIIRKERPDALLPTMGGQTGLNLAMELSQAGVLSRFSVELIGARESAILAAENRDIFKQVLISAGVDFPASGYAKDLQAALKILEGIQFPCIIRPSFTLGGTGASIAYNVEEFSTEVCRGLEASPVSEVLIEESVLGWKEYELEVIRDSKDNVAIICSIENLDPMGVHTGDSITVAPVQTLTDVEYQKMRDSAIRIIRGVGVDTGGSNIQFAVHPTTGRQVAIEMNPRVSRSSALASKATGFPIAKIAAKLAVGCTLDEIPNDITQKTASCFEPSIDYVVTKIPRFAFEKFPRSVARLSPQMKSVGEVMAIGRTFKESLQKAFRSLETGLWGLQPILDRRKIQRKWTWLDDIKTYVREPRPDRLLWVAQALREKVSVDELNALTKIDPWFLSQIRELVEAESCMSTWIGRVPTMPPHDVRRWKRLGFSDAAIAHFCRSTEEEIRSFRFKHDIKPSFKMVDTCAAEFESSTPYLYSTYEEHSDPLPETGKKKVVILGGGPNRIGQGIEFDYCCVRASIALREEGYESIMVNCNPETVSTDYDVSNKLYFEPLFLEDLINILEHERPHGIIVHFGGQTPLNLSRELRRLNYPIVGTSADAIEVSEDREKFRSFCLRFGIRQPESVTITSQDAAQEAAEKLGFPVLVRPSFVLGGGGMEIIYDARDFQRWLLRDIKVSTHRPLLIDRFLKNAIEVDVDAIGDGKDVLVCGIMEQIHEAGVHSGDSACSLPPMTLSPEMQSELGRLTHVIATQLNVKGFLNIQFAIENGDIYVLEVNPRASRTVPFVSKARGIPFCHLATKVMLGRSLAELTPSESPMKLVYVKESIFPFKRFHGTDIVLGPEMRSTGEVMGVGSSFGEAYGKAIVAAGFRIPSKGSAFLSVKDSDKEAVVPIAETLLQLGFKLYGTRGTTSHLRNRGIEIELVNKVHEGRPHAVDLIINNVIQLVVNTSSLGIHEVGDFYEFRRTTLRRNLPYFTTIAAARAATQAIATLREVPVRTHCLQDRSKQ